MLAGIVTMGCGDDCGPYGPTQPAPRESCSFIRTPAILISVIDVVANDEKERCAVRPLGQWMWMIRGVPRSRIFRLGVTARTVT